MVWNTSIAKFNQKDNSLHVNNFTHLEASFKCAFLLFHIRHIFLNTTYPGTSIKDYPWNEHRQICSENNYACHDFDQKHETNQTVAENLFCKNFTKISINEEIGNFDSFFREEVKNGS